MSRNDSDTGLRVMKSIEAHGLDITRASSGAGAPIRIHPSFQRVPFSVGKQTGCQGGDYEWPSGWSGSRYEIPDDATDNELRIAFDFDGVLASDEAEAIFREEGLEKFQSTEKEKASVCHNPGPLKELLHKLARIQAIERERVKADPNYKPRLRVAIITARNAPAHERMIRTLRAWGIAVDETFLLGGIEKTKVLEVFTPHIFFDDQRIHLDAASGFVPSVHIPFGIANIESSEKVCE